jgi:hypothetical protein
MPVARAAASPSGFADPGARSGGGRLSFVKQMKRRYTLSDAGARDPARERLREALQGYLTEEELASLVRETLSITKKASVQCPHCHKMHSC